MSINPSLGGVVLFREEVSFVEIKGTDSGPASSEPIKLVSAHTGYADLTILGGLESPSSVDVQILVSRVFHQSSTRNALSAMELCCSAYERLLGLRADLSNKPLAYWRQCLESNAERSWQIGDLVHIPKAPGSLFLLSDLEGHKEILEKVLKRHHIVDRIIKNDPNDQVYLVLMGDTIDRAGNRATEILEALYDLQINFGLQNNIYILSGNHELEPDVIQRDPNQGGFFHEVCFHRDSYQNPLDYWAELSEASKERIQFVCNWTKTYYPEYYGCEELLVALWRLHNEVFRAAPKSIVTENGLFIAHAGITDKGPFASIASGEQTEQLAREAYLRWLSLASEDGATLQDLVWSDYTPYCDHITTNARGGIVNGEATPGPGLAFGRESLKHFLSLVGEKTCMIRGHQVGVPEGCTSIGESVWTNGVNLVTLNSARCGEYLEVPLGVDIVEPEQITVHTAILQK